MILIALLQLCFLQAGKDSPVLQERWNVRHPSMVTAVAAAPDSRWIAAGLDDGRLLAFSPETRKEIPIPFRFYGSILDLSCSPDGKVVALSNRYGELHLLDTTTWEGLAATRSTSSFNRLRFSSDGGLYAGRMDGHLLKLATTDLKILKEVVPNKESLVLGCAVSPDGKTLATGDKDGRVFRWSKDLDPLGSWKAHEKAVYAVAWEPQSGRLVTGAEDHALRVWDGERMVSDFSEVHHEGIKSLAFAADGRLISGGQDGLCQFWEPGSLKAARSFTGYRGFITSVATTADGKWLVRGGSMLDLVPLEAPDRAIRLREFGGAIIALAGDRTGTVWASGSLDRSAMIWTYTKSLSAKALPLEDWPDALALSKDALHLAVGRHDGILELFATDTLQRKVQVAAHRAAVVAAGFSGDGQSVLTAGADGRIVAHSLAGAKLFEVDLESPIRSAAFDPAGRWIVAGFAGGNLNVVDLAGRSRSAKLSGRPFGVTSIAASRDGSQVVAGYFDGTVVLWDSSTWKELRSRPGEGSSALSVDFSPAGSRVAVGFRDGSIAVLERDTLQTVAASSAARREVFGVRFTVDENTLITAGADHAVTLRMLGEARRPAAAGPWPKTDGPARWKGSWSSPSGFVYDFVVELTLDGQNVVGQIHWTLIKAPGSRTEYRGREGHKGIEYVKGKFDPSTRLVELAGERVSDPTLLGLDEYRLTLSPSGDGFDGKTKGSQGAWDCAIKGELVR